MDRKELLARVTTDRNICGGLAVVRGTRVPISVLLDSLAAGATPEQIIEQYPHITVDDIRGALAYASELAKENVWKVGV